MREPEQPLPEVDLVYPVVASLDDEEIVQHSPHQSPPPGEASTPSPPRNQFSPLPKIFASPQGSSSLLPEEDTDVLDGMDGVEDDILYQEIKIKGQSCSIGNFVNVHRDQIQIHRDRIQIHTDWTRTPSTIQNGL